MRSTIAILCYNQASIIGRTVTSAINQTALADEIVVVDDGSTDNSVEVLRGIDGVTLICHDENRGRAATRNTLLHAAAGDIVVYLDGDTIARPDLLSNLLPAYADPSVGGVGGQGIEMFHTTPWDRWRTSFAAQSWGPDPRADVPWLFGLSCSFRREALLEVGGFLGFSEDLQVSFALHKLGYKLRYVPEAVVEHHRQDDRASLEHMLFRWWRGGYLVERRWGVSNPWRYAGGILKSLAKQSFQHVREHDWVMLPVDFWAALAKVRGAVEGHRVWGREVRGAPKANPDGANAHPATGS
jgi:cellulose synthase/poly-beta-1,6-N-acetylglucosamine synthase-like glycosyltransferase